MLADDVASALGKTALKAVEIIVEIMARQGTDVLLWGLKKAATMSASMIMIYMRGNMVDISAMVDLSALHQQAGGDLRMFLVAPELERSVKADLRRRGVGYSVEHGADGKIYLHFSGRDIRTIQHGLRQAAARYERKLEKRNNRTIRRSLRRESWAKFRLRMAISRPTRRALRLKSKVAKAKYDVSEARYKTDEALSNAGQARDAVKQATLDKRALPYKSWLRGKAKFLKFKAERAQKKLDKRILRSHKLALDAKYAQYRADRAEKRAQSRYEARFEKIQRWRDKRLKDKDNFYSQPVPYEPVPYEDQPDRKDDQQPDHDKKRDEDKSDRNKDQKPDLDNDQQQPDRDQDQQPDRDQDQQPDRDQKRDEDKSDRNKDQKPDLDNDQQQPDRDQDQQPDRDQKRDEGQPDRDQKRDEGQPDRDQDQQPDRDKKRDEDKSDRDKDQKPDLDNDQQQPDRDQDQQPDRDQKRDEGQPDRDQDQQPDRDQKRDEGQPDRDQDQQPDRDQKRDEGQPDRKDDQQPDHDKKRDEGQPNKGKPDNAQPDKWQPGQKPPKKISRKEMREIIRQRTQKLAEESKKKVNSRYTPSHNRGSR